MERIGAKWWSDKYQAFYATFTDSQHNDVTCVSGTKTSDGKYEINGNYTTLQYNQESKKVKSFTITLQKQGNNYLFVSNIMN